MSQPYFLGDPHWGHRNILKYRSQFSSIEEHDNTILENILNVSDKRAVLYLMGDCFFDMEAIRFLEEIRPRFMHVHWILGNHDTDSKLRQQVFREVIKRDLVDNVHSLKKYHEFWLSHAPIHESELRGHKNIHGHTHENFVDDDRYVPVSLEHTGFKPISLQQIRDLTRSE